jgi:histone H1/5
MTVTTEKIADALAARAEVARHMAEGASAKAKAKAAKMRAKSDAAQAKMRAKSDAAQAKMAGKMAAKMALDKTAVKAGMAKRAGKLAVKSRAASEQARAMMQDRVIPTVVPMASSMMDQASHKLDELKVASAPARKEAMRRGMLAAAVLRGAEPVVVKKRRRWPVAMLFLAVGGAIGAAVAWLSQAGKPVQLTPYPIPAEEGDKTVDLTSEDAARHES